VPAVGRVLQAMVHIIKNKLPKLFFTHQQKILPDYGQFLSSVCLDSIAPQLSTSFMKSYVWQIWPTCQELSPMKQLTWRMARLLKLHPGRDRRVRSVDIEFFDSKRDKWVTITKQSIRHIARWKLCFMMQSMRLFRSESRPRLLPRLIRPIVSIPTRLSICLKPSLLQCYALSVWFKPHSDQFFNCMTHIDSFQLGTLVITYLIDTSAM
jgi:hypothetical protein